MIFIMINPVTSKEKCALAHFSFDCKSHICAYAHIWDLRKLLKLLGCGVLFTKRGESNNICSIYVVPNNHHTLENTISL